MEILHHLDRLQRLLCPYRLPVKTTLNHFHSPPFLTQSSRFYPETSDRKLEDIDRFFRENHDILVFRDKDAIASKRPAAYIEHEQREVRRNSSVVSANPEAVRRRLAKMNLANEELDAEKGDAYGFEHNEKVDEKV